jgi:FkbM family methyltransferase
MFVKNLIKHIIRLVISDWKKRAQLRWLVDSILGKRYYFSSRLKLHTIQVGSVYGGYQIYPISPPLHNALIVFSFGIGEDCSFDKEIIEKYGATVYAFDPTPRAIQFIEKQNLPKESFKFFPLALGTYDGETQFLLPVEDDPEPSGSVFQRERLKGGNKITIPIQRLKTVMELTGVSKIAILKMDIEGSEFVVIDDILECGIDITQFCIEFHVRIFPDDGVKKMRKAIANLKKHGYLCCAVSCNGYEATFVKANCLVTVPMMKYKRV